MIKSGGSKKSQKIQLLLDNGADINYINRANSTPAINAAGWGGQYGIALQLLESGADFSISMPRSNTRLIHIVLGEERRSKAWSPQQQSDYQRLVKWLEDHGESVDEARSDIERWKSWSMTTGEYRRQLDAEVAQRKAREKAAKQKREEAPMEP